MNLQEFNDVKDHCSQLKKSHVERDNLFTKMEDIFLLKWDLEGVAKSKMKGVKVTKYPGPRNTLMGMIRLLVASEPEFSVPSDETYPKLIPIANKLEKAANTIWKASGRQRGDPCHYDVVRTAGIYGESHINIILTKDHLTRVEGLGGAVAEDAQEMANSTPIMFEPLNPKYGYPEWDRFGKQKSFYSVKNMNVGDIIDMYGADAKQIIEGKLKEKYSRYTNMALHQFVDSTVRYDWGEGLEVPFIEGNHNQKRSTVVSTLIEGTRLFENPEDQRQPFLYSYWKSGLWNRQNLWLTAFWTILYGIGFTPTFVDEQGRPNQESQIKWDGPLGKVLVPPDNKFYALDKKVLDPSMIRGYEIAQNLEVESTMYKTTMGEPLGPNSAFSMVALLAQAGRLPLVVVQRKTGWIIADAMIRGLKLMKDNSFSWKSEFTDQFTLAPRDIPKNFEIEASLEVSLPQDQLQMANVANLLTQGEKPIVSKRWVRENVLNIGQSEDMEKEIMDETSATMHYGKWIQQFIEMAAQAEAMQQEGMGMEGEVPPEMMGGGGEMMPPPPEGEEGVPPVMPNLQGLPNEMATGGAGPLRQPLPVQPNEPLQ